MGLRGDIYKYDQMSLATNRALSLELGGGLDSGIHNLAVSILIAPTRETDTNPQKALELVVAQICKPHRIGEPGE